MLGMEVAMTGLCGQSLTGRVTAKAGMQGRRCSVKYGAYSIRCSSREKGFVLLPVPGSISLQRSGWAVS